MRTFVPVIVGIVYFMALAAPGYAHSRGIDDKLIHVSACTENTIRTISIVKQGLHTIPAPVKHSLLKAGYEIVIVPMTEDVENPDTHPPGYAQYKSWRNVAGAFRGSKRQIIIAESVCLKSSLPVFNTHADETVRHEMGHAYDQYMGITLKQNGNISASSAFKAAYYKDSEILPRRLRKDYHYFLQPGESGRKELFAELFSGLCSGGADDTSRDRQAANLIRFFPSTTKLVKDLINRHKL